MAIQLIGDDAELIKWKVRYVVMSVVNPPASVETIAIKLEMYIAVTRPNLSLILPPIRDPDK